MSSSKLRASLLGLVIGLMLPACGFKPVYGTGSAARDKSVVVQFAAIQIPVLTDRRGQQLRNMLIDSLHPGGAAGEYRYTLNIQLRAVDVDLGLQENATSTRGQVRATAQYWLVDRQTQKTLLHETLRSAASYNILINQFSSQLSSDDAHQKVNQEISDNITEHLALYFHDNPTS